MLDIVCWKWKPVPRYRSTFDASTVNVLRAMVARNLSLPHRFSCITDDSKGIDSEIRIIPLRHDFADVPNPSSRNNPSCYRRLTMFKDDAKDFIGERIVSLDLDMVVTGSLDELFGRSEDFVIWGGQSVQPSGGAVYNWYNGSAMMLRAGTRTSVWTAFNPNTSPREANAAGCRGSDQGWLSYHLGKNEAIWGEQDGVYSFRSSIVPKGGRLPENARLVAFHGKHDPWQKEVQRTYPWIKRYYRL